MKFLFKIILIVIFTLGISESRANTLFDSLNLAYLNNPKLNAERASMRATREEKRESISEFLPNVTISGYISDQQNTKTGGSDSNFKPAEQSITIEQKIFLYSLLSFAFTYFLHIKFLSSYFSRIFIGLFSRE